MIKTIVIDGNDGTGKSTLINKLKEYFPHIEFFDRDLPTELTNLSDGTLQKIDKIKGDKDLYIILDLCPDICQERLLKRGADITEKYHTLDDLKKYRKRFIFVNNVLERCYLFDSGESKDLVFDKVFNFINQIMRSI